MRNHAVKRACSGFTSKARPASLHDVQEDRGKKRMNFLLQQAEVFQHFADADLAAEGRKYVLLSIF